MKKSIEKVQFTFLIIKKFNLIPLFSKMRKSLIYL
ncbi:hypothetical protein GYH30_056379 [Glycine max]|nr:hypothetical protein GYH30_056379 [Glycine max]